MAAIFFSVLTLLLTSPLISSSSKTLKHRRILHQPFFPQINSLPPNTQTPLQSPQSQPQQQQPKYPFSSLYPPNTGNPFFPFFPSPPQVTSVATFPANISSLILPQTSSSSSKPISRKLVAIAVSLSLLSAALITAIAAFLLHHSRHGKFSHIKGSTTDNIRLFPSNSVSSDGRDPKPRPIPHYVSVASSSEFLYLGTLSGVKEEHRMNYAGDSSYDGANSSMQGYQKLRSPELRPLPPLPRQQRYPNQEIGSNQENEVEEEFFSPRSSSGRKGSPTRVFLGGESENFGHRSSNSRTASYPSSNSSSPSNSMSSSPFIALNLSSRSLRSKLPDSVVHVPPPILLPIGSPSPPSTAKETNLGNIPSSPARDSNVRKTPEKKLPPAPPPFPPPRFWDIPWTVNREGPPVLVTPSRSVVFQNPEAGSISMSEQRNDLKSIERSNETPKPKLKPLHWDKVRTSSDRAMAWDQLKSSSFQLNEEMIETLFMMNSSSLTPKDNSRPSMLNQENRVLDPKKSQNIAILLRALSVTIDEVCEALLEGNADTLGTDFLESLLKMAPTKEEEGKLKEFNDESLIKLGPAEKFLKALLDIPFAFERVDAMLYIANFDSEVEYLKRSFQTLETACEELRKSRMFLKLLEAVLKTGNRMNVGTTRGDAHAFKLDTLLKLVDVKGADGKTTLLHFVVQEISRAEGSRISGVFQIPTSDENLQSNFPKDVELSKIGLQVVSGLGGELANVKKAAAMDSNVLSIEVTKLALGSSKIKVVLKLIEEGVPKESSNRNFSCSMNDFLKKAELEIANVQAQDRVSLSLVKEITEYFHGNSAKEEAHPFRIFMVVRDFLSILDQVCKDVGKINQRSVVSSTRPFSQMVSSNLRPVFPGFIQRRQYRSSDDESSSSSS